MIAAGRWSPAQQAKIKKVMEEFKAGTLENGHGGKVTSKRQALAIALSKARELTAAGFDESAHPRKGKGEKGGGQFTTKAAGRAEADKALAEQRAQFGAEGVKEMVEDELSPEGRERGREMGSDDTTEEFHQGWEERMDEERQVIEGAEGAEEGDGEVDPYATDYDEAGGDAVQGYDDLDLEREVYGQPASMYSADRMPPPGDEEPLVQTSADGKTMRWNGEEWEEVET
ncbi:MAG TPA: DUF6496 domain-containing protein, partial [Candidatus Eisenbacteria bacterium]|nr:DUF6496 domain-containing protein [Candidatus Eisenbacteria bacterium]